MKISIIVCSRREDIEAGLKENINATIGCEYEVVAIDNSGNRYSIFQAYNEGVRRANGEILCFMHDDIMFRCEGWGKTIAEILQDESIGIVGVEGNHFLPDTPAYWSLTPFVTDYVIDNDHGKIENFFKCDYYDEQGLSEVVVVDGVFMCMRKERFKNIHFDEDTYKGFHMYDMDICMQAQKEGLRVMATNRVLIEHAWSEGDMKKKKGMGLFAVNNEKFTQKWKEMLPIWRGGPTIPEYSKDRLNRLYRQAYDATMARRSKAYRLGRAILSPINAIQRLFGNRK